MDIEGNEAADVKAKDATTGIISVRERLPPLLRDTLPVSVAALKGERKKSMPARWLPIWTTSPRFARMAKIDKDMPSAQTVKMLRKLPRRASSILTQLRTGHVGLNVFLKKIKAVDSALCARCGHPETVAHYIFHCQRYTCCAKDLNVILNVRDWMYSQLPNSFYSLQ